MTQSFPKIPTYIQAPFVGRECIAYFLNENNLVGEAVEVGTHRGDFAKQFLDYWNGEKLYGIDPWENPPGYEEQAKFLWGGGDRAQDFQECLIQLHLHRQRFVPIKNLSSVAVQQFQDKCLSFVYIDGDHRRDMVYQDLCLWWEKLSSPGVIAGHDIICPYGVIDDWGPEIQPAVNRFALEKDTSCIYLIHEEKSSPWSYMMIKV